MSMGDRANARFRPLKCLLGFRAQRVLGRSSLSLHLMLHSLRNSRADYDNQAPSLSLPCAVAKICPDSYTKLYVCEPVQKIITVTFFSFR